MSIFTDVKAAVTTRQAAEFYGFRVKTNGMMCCPFHDDRNPSMKVDDRFYCFGCQSNGDVIDFAGRIFHLTPRKAAQKLADDFHLNSRRPVSGKTTPDISLPSRKERSAYQTMHQYELLLEKWKKEYAPRDREAAWDDHFVAALQTLTLVSYWTDQLASGDQLTREEAIKELHHDGTLDQVRAFLREHSDSSLTGLSPAA